MKSKVLKLLALGFALIASENVLKAQQKVSVRIDNAFDDLEEWIAGPPTQTKTIGAIDWNSSDLEFGYESSTSDPQMVGLRFKNIAIPRGSLITKAYIQFTVDATSKNADPCKIVIRFDPSDNSAALDSNKFHLSNRNKSTDSVLWSVSDKSNWATVGAAGADQRTADLSALIQQIVDRNGWSSGNAMSFFLTGNGTREVESFDGDAANAPLLVIEFVPAVTLSVRINNAFDDLEEWIPGPPAQNNNVGEIDWNSSDLEFGYENSTADPQLVGLRFNNITIPKGSLIRNSYIQFTVDATSKNADPCNVVIRYEPVDNAPAMGSAKFHLTKRTQSADSIYWAVSNKTNWNSIGLAGIDQRTPDMSPMLQNLVNRSGWNSGNSMAFFLKGNGTREVESYDGDAPKAPLLVITYVPLVSKSVRINNAFDDLEEWIAGPPTQTKTVGDIDWNSSDLEFGYESSTSDPQLLGLRFNNIDVPKGAKVQNAYIQFTVDASAKNADPCSVVIRCEPADNAAALDSNNFHLTNRNKSTDSVVWNVSDKSKWNTVGAAGEDHRTSNISTLVQQLLDRNGWAAKNSMVFFMKGNGTREVESYDGDAPKAPMLVIEYYGETTGGGNTNPGYTALPVTNFPLGFGQKWNFWDKGNKPSALWMDTLNNDSSWGQGTAPLGYGDAHIKTNIGFGGNANNKFITSWFRKIINVPSLSAIADTLELNVLFDDGLAIYINGTELKRIQLPSSSLDSSVLASTAKEGMQEQLYYSFDVPKSLLRNGKNTIAVEVHQSSTSSSDLGFDLELKSRSMKINPKSLICTGSSDAHITCFESILPIDHVDSMHIPSTHTFQRIFSQGDAYTVGGGTAKGSNDFTGFIPKNGSSTEGWLSINHETSPGAVSILDLHFDCNTGLWVVDSSRSVDFATDIVLTASNCSGGVTPWGTVVTCEETTSGGDVNGDGYNDLGWMVEINPATKKVVQYGSGKAQKLWAMGRMSHENVVFQKDSLTAYYGEDAGAGNVWKFVADQKTNFSSGKLYVLKLDSGMAGNEPRGTNGKWIQIANTSAAERNNIRSAAITAGATGFNGVEDVEIDPITGDIFFTAKGASRIYRFKDNGSSVSGFVTHAGGTSYRINTNEGVISEPWGSGNDNLTFDSRGNLYVLQDGGKDHIWVLKNGHSQANPKVEIFMTTPGGSEPTGMTFTPNEKFIFLSIQSPNAGNSTIQKDAAGNNVVFNKATTLVIARDEVFSAGAKASFAVNDTTQCLSGNSFALTNNSGSRVNSSWNFGNGANSTQQNPVYTYSAAGSPKITLNTTDAINGCKSSASKTVTVYPKPSALVITGYTNTVQGSTQPYSVNGKSGSTYQWTITNGSQTAGGNTKDITVKWSQTAATGKVKVRETDINGCSGDASEVLVNLATNAIEKTGIEGLRLYPNPTSQLLYIQSYSDITWMLYDMSGKEILSGHNRAGNIQEIDIEAFTAGLYTIRISDGQHTVNTQIIKN